MQVKMWGYVFKDKETGKYEVGAANSQETRDTWEECVEEPARRFTFNLNLDERLFAEPQMTSDGCEVEDTVTHHNADVKNMTSCNGIDC